MADITPGKQPDDVDTAALGPCDPLEGVSLGCDELRRWLPRVVQELVEIALDHKQPGAVRVKAAAEILDRAGLMGEPQEAMQRSADALKRRALEAIARGDRDQEVPPKAD